MFNSVGILCADKTTVCRHRYDLKSPAKDLFVLRFVGRIGKLARMTWPVLSELYSRVGVNFAAQVHHNAF